MSKTYLCEAIILKSHDVGEADRFCIIFTRERGKLAARARSVRKLGSRLGGHLLPMRHVQLELRESSAGYIVRDAKRRTAFDEKNIMAFLQAQQGIELLITILQDDEPLPELFDATLAFLSACAGGAEHTVLPFTLKLLQLCGLLPDMHDPYFERCTPKQKRYLADSCRMKWENLPTLSAEERKLFSLLCANLLSHISTASLKAGLVMNTMHETAHHKSPIQEGCEGLPPISV